MAADLGISADEVERLQAATGYVVCPGTTERNGIVASGALVGSSQVVLTVGHAFVDEAGRPRAPLTDCVFRNQASPPREVPIRGDFIYVGFDGEATPHDPEDFAVAVLAAPVRGATPLQLRQEPVEAGTRVVGLVAWQEIEGMTLDPNMPVAQDCAVRAVEDSDGSVPTNYLTDCDLGPVGSGGQILTRAGGEWIASGFFSTSGGARSVGRSFNVRLGSYTRAIGVDSGVAAALERALATLR